MPDNDNVYVDEDDPNYSWPTKPSALRQMSDDEFFKLSRQVTITGSFAMQAQQELTIRLIHSMQAFKRSSERVGKALVVLTVVLVILTLVLVVLTFRL